MKRCTTDNIRGLELLTKSVIYEINKMTRGKWEGVNCKQGIATEEYVLNVQAEE